MGSLYYALHRSINESTYNAVFLCLNIHRQAPELVSRGQLEKLTLATVPMELVRLFELMLMLSFGKIFISHSKKFVILQATLVDEHACMFACVSNPIVRHTRT